METLKVVNNIRDDGHSIRQSLIAEFLWSCSGIDKDLLRVCPFLDMMKYFLIGLVLLVLGITAAYSCSMVVEPFCADLSELQQLGIVLLSSLFVGILVFVLIRLTTVTMYGSKKRGAYKLIICSIIPRIIFNGILGISVVYPFLLSKFNSGYIFGNLDTTGKDTLIDLIIAYHQNICSNMNYLISHYVAISIAIVLSVLPIIIYFCMPSFRYDQLQEEEEETYRQLMNKHRSNTLNLREQNK